MFDIGAIVQVPLHYLDTTKADDKNLTLIVMEMIQKVENMCPLYHMGYKACVLDRLNHRTT